MVTPASAMLPVNESRERRNKITMPRSMNVKATASGAPWVGGA